MAVASRRLTQWRKVYSVHRRQLRRSPQDYSANDQDTSSDDLPGMVVVPGTSFGRGVKLLLPEPTDGQLAGSDWSEPAGRGKQAIAPRDHLMTLLVPTWYGVSVSQSADWGNSWGPPSPFLPHGRHKESVVLRSGPQVRETNGFDCFSR